MPIENELKYILPLDFDATTLSGWEKHGIRQAYLNDGPRIRQINADHIFTYKKWIAQVKELVEIETAISQDDFELLWSQRVQSLEKTRYEKHIGAAEWVVDFLHDPSGRNFVVMAEVELPRYVLQPDMIPDEIATRILYSVPAGDNRFTNKKLSDPDYAAKMYEELVLPQP
jgi:CYTH domain-containing protein